jgi:photosystem II stability/assembly factor-like uncharacterized protein
LKKKLKLRALAFVAMLLSTLIYQPSISFAQGTALTYQGQLNDTGGAANGSYDLTFTVFDAVTDGTLVGGPLTNTATVISNGLFTVTLDFGTGIFTGPARWLEIGVQTNGGADSYTFLVPRQAITASPYAITAGNVTGAVADSQLSGNIARLNSDAVFTGAVVFSNAASQFAGTVTAAGFNGPGTLPWQIVSGTAQQAQPNMGYLLTNAAQVTVTLPTAPNPGDVVRVSGTGTNGWKIAQNVGQSVVGRNISAVNIDHWIPSETNRNWYSVASSSDGSKLVAVVNAGPIYTSTDSGVTWMPRESNRVWYSVASSSDGSKLVAVDNAPGRIYNSTDSGVTWTPHANNRFWRSVASSSDGSQLVAVAGADQIFTSTDSGANWTPRSITANWWSVASSGDGSQLVAVVNAGLIYTSVDSGVTWTPRASSRQWYAVASSADGSKLVAVVNGGQIYTSADSGANWTAGETNRAWRSVASSSDGSILVAVINSGGRIYTRNLDVAGYLLSDPNSAVELQYIGNGVFIVISHEGNILAY